MTNAPSAPADRRSSAPESENTPQWRVSPAPDGRGEQPEEKPPWIPRDRPWVWWLFAALLVAQPRARLRDRRSGEPRSRCRTSRSSSQQLQAGNVESISSLQDSIDGELKRAVRYDPPGQAQPVDVTKLQDAGPGLHRSRRS